MKLKTLLLGTVALSLAAGVAYKTGHLEHPLAEAVAVKLAAASKEIKRTTGFDMNKSFGNAVSATTQWIDERRQQGPQTAAADDKSESPAEMCGIADQIKDGKSFTLRSSSNPALRVQLAEIEAPEAFHTYSKISTRALESLISQREVCLTSSEGRPLEKSDEPVVAWAWRKGDRASVNHQMVAGGHAYATAFGLTDSTLLEHQTFAQRERRGMWAVTALAEPLSTRMSQNN